ncbi:T6SS phospholipase effector Tle1-like catalytic domain-containing protein [Denitromonas ohlonensis]|uniref:DUF2235 domain-containing protein n=2 Tax=Denitromonas TaxID=139331 RepID=A0A557RR13_9RHOO|nr:DUF2235 domain-containing protein [Denitromonas ohlonensis]TVO67608.1 DUF2235 domain-containing protein [Denitromonas ohlonensis]TVO76466.1 DUF2235 domain-containing protein [Denitromonas ohlonensis]
MARRPSVKTPLQTRRHRPAPIHRRRNEEVHGAMSATTPPTNLPGLRALSAREQAQRVAAYGCIADTKKPSCRQTIWVGMFFDGTNNNKHRDQELIPNPNARSHSNVVVLHDAFRDERKEGYYAYYVPGVGTAFPEIGETTESSNGKSMATGGEARLYWAMIQLYNAVNWAIHGRNLIAAGEAKTSIRNPDTLKNGWTLFSGKRRAFFEQAERRLRQSIAHQKPEITLINVSTFGFSRGAAQARAWANWVLECCKSEAGAYTFCGIPIRFQFMGLFDTVASVGLADSSPIGGDGLMDWADGSMAISPAIERCVHYVAAHEIRKSFPLSTARDGAAYPANCVEVVYPGAHSDVGGGYAPGEQGKAPGRRALLASQVPLVNMYLEARKSGVPLLDPTTLVTENKDEVVDDLKIDPTLATRFRDYTVWSAGSAAKVEDLLFKHMRLYWRWRLRVAPQFKKLTSYQRANAQDREDLTASEGDFQRDVARAMERKRRKDDMERRRTMHPIPGRQLPPATSTPVYQAAIDEAARTSEVPEPVHAFFDEHVHDSHASFYLAGPLGTYDRAEKLQLAKDKQRRGETLTAFEGRMLAEDARSPGSFPVMQDSDYEDLLDMEDKITELTVKRMTDTRRESDGHVRRRVVFDRS